MQPQSDQRLARKFQVLINVPKDNPACTRNNQRHGGRNNRMPKRPLPFGATKFKPRYSAFWQTPKTATDIHCFRLSLQLCPNISAIITPIKPEIKNRAESE